MRVRSVIETIGAHPPSRYPASRLNVGRFLLDVSDYYVILTLTICNSVADDLNS
jgi:hypothetical protein